MRLSIATAIIFLLLPNQSFGNGRHGFFVENLERSANNLHGYSVHYVYITHGADGTPGSDWAGFCLYGIRLNDTSLFISVGKEEVYVQKDIMTSRKESCGDNDQIVQFKNKDLNKNDLIILNPVDPKAKKLSKLKIVPFDSLTKHFDVFKNKGIVPKEDLQIGDQHIEFKVAYDLDLDRVPDLSVFTHAVDYTHTYLLGNKASKWVILNVEFPL
jgi:hypothetical protein